MAIPRQWQLYGSWHGTRHGNVMARATTARIMAPPRHATWMQANVHKVRAKGW